MKKINFNGKIITAAAARAIVRERMAEIPPDLAGLIAAIFPPIKRICQGVPGGMAAWLRREFLSRGTIPRAEIETALNRDHRSIAAMIHNLRHTEPQMTIFYNRITKNWEYQKEHVND